MAMAWVWTVMAAAAVIFGALTGRMAQVGAAALEGRGRRWSCACRWRGWCACGRA